MFVFARTVAIVVIGKRKGRTAMNIWELESILTDLRYDYCFGANINVKHIIVKEIYAKDNDMFIVIENNKTHSKATYSANLIRQHSSNAKILG